MDERRCGRNALSFRRHERRKTILKSQHQIIIDAPRDVVWAAFCSGQHTCLIDEITEERKPDFVAGTADSRGCRAIIVGHFANAGPDATRITVYANRFFTGLRKLTSVLSGRSLKQDIDDKLGRLKLAIESRAT